MGLTFIDCETTGVDPLRHNVWEIGLVTDSGEYRFTLELTPDELIQAEPMALTVGRYYERSTAARDKASEAAGRFRNNPHTAPAEGNLIQYRRDAIRDYEWATVRERHIVAEFLALEIDTSHLVGAVPSFDARFIGDFLRAHRFVPSWHYHLVDVEALAAGKLGIEPPWKSKDLYRALGLDPERFDEHTALGDARMAKAIYELVFDLPSSYPEALLDDAKET